MFEKMSDGDVAVYLRNAALQMSKVAQERGIDIGIIIHQNGYTAVRLNDYEVLRIEKEDEIRYVYRPLGEISAWRSNISPQSIQFGMPPQEVQHGE